MTRRTVYCHPTHYIAPGFEKPEGNFTRSSAGLIIPGMGGRADLPYATRARSAYNDADIGKGT